MSSPAVRREPSEPAKKLIVRGERVLSALQPLSIMAPPAPEAARAAAVNLGREMERLKARLSGGRVEFGLFGLPKAGKSTLLNALAGKMVSAVDVLPETAFPIYLVPAASADARCRVFFHPSLNRMPVELAPEDLGKITRDKSIWNPKEVAFAEVPSRTEVLGPGFCFIDTPGLDEFVADYGDSSDRLLNDETDAAILVATPDQAMRDTVRKFLELATRRCPRLWIVLNVDLNAAGLRPDGTREILGVGEFERLRKRFLERLTAEVKGLALMLKEGTAGLHIFSARACVDKRLAGATLESLDSDPGGREFATLARAARAYSDDPSREEHAVKFWRKRLREFANDSAGAVDRAAEPEDEKLAGLKKALAAHEAGRAEHLRQVQALQEVLDAGVAEAVDAFRTVAYDALGPFFQTPLRQAVAGWHRSSESLRTMHDNVKSALRGEFESAKIRLRDLAAERAGKLAACMPDLGGGIAPEPTWIHPVLSDEPPAALVGDLARLPIWLGRTAAILYVLFTLTIGGLLFSLFGMFLPLDHSQLTTLGMFLVFGGTLLISQGVKFWTRRELITRNWSGWTKRFFLPGDQEHIRAIYEDHIRDFARAEAEAGGGWLRGFAAKLLEGRKKEEPAELVEARKAATEQQGRSDVLHKAAAELRARAEEAE